MTIDRQKLRELISRPPHPAGPEELRREGNVFFVGGELPARETLETLFESHCQAPAELFHLSFGGVNRFHQGEELARQIKKNFNAHLLGRFDYPAPPHIIQRAYAAGVDIVDIPLNIFDQALSREKGLERSERLDSLKRALDVFPRWSVASSLLAGVEPSCSTISGIDALLASGIVPLVELSPRAAHYPPEEMTEIFSHLASAWRKGKVVIKPYVALTDITTPLRDSRSKGLLRGFIEKVNDRRLLATSDLRRGLRVRQVEESFESAGL